MQETQSQWERMNKMLLTKREKEVICAYLSLARDEFLMGAIKGVKSKHISAEKKAKDLQLLYGELAAVEELHYKIRKTIQ
jgi:hypothetical protein